MRDRSILLTHGRYKGYILQTLPDAVVETLWEELDGDNAYAPGQRRVYSNEERDLLDLLIKEIVQRWHRNRDDVILPTGKPEAPDR